MKYTTEKNDFVFEGPLTIGPEVKRTNYRIRDLVAYCEEKGIEPVDLEEEERKQFELESF